MQPGQESAVFLRCQGRGHGPVFRSDIIIVVNDAESMAQEAELPHADKGQRDFIPLVVAVGILFPESPQDFRQFFRGFRCFQIQLLQPVGIDPQGIVVLEAVECRKRRDGAVRERDRLLRFRIFFQQFPQVRRILFQIGRQVDDPAGLIQVPYFGACQFRLEQNIRQVLPLQDLLFPLRPSFRIGKLGEL